MFDKSIETMKTLIGKLNRASKLYYNTNNTIMSDEEYDKLYDELKALEKNTGIILSNSPTQKVGSEVLTKLKKIKHVKPMLSLDKCHSAEEVLKFADRHNMICSIKLDGLTVRITYNNGKLVSAETRGDGYTGSDITEHIKMFINVPLTINAPGEYIIDGEAIINDLNFAEINKNNEFKNSRNLASGTLSSLDTSLVKERKLQFIAWDIVYGSSFPNLLDRLKQAEEYGFEVVPHWFLKGENNTFNTNNNIEFALNYAKEKFLPNDGLVFKFDNIAYGESLGYTNHHYKSGIAYKPPKSLYKTKFKYIDWSVGKTGVITPTAVFEPVEIDGTIVERASVHNLSIYEELNLWEHDVIEVYKANEIIPQINKNISEENRNKTKSVIKGLLPIARYCPVCNKPTSIVVENHTRILKCNNSNCLGKLLGRLNHFVSRDAMNIDGLSEATLKKFIELGWVKTFTDIYRLERFKEDMRELNGFGDKSINKLLKSIENSKNTTLERFIYALSIPNIGITAAKTISKYFNGDFEKFYFMADVGMDWKLLNDFGETMSYSMGCYFIDHYYMIRDLANFMNFKKDETAETVNKIFDNKTFCITGSLKFYSNRNELVSDIEKYGGKVTGSVSKRTDYLLTNDTSSGSSKNKKAEELNISIITEEDFITMIKNN